MSVKSVKLKGNLGSAISDDAWSPGIWGDCPIEAIRDGELPGHVFEFEFGALPTTPPTTEGAFGLFTAFTSTGGFFNAATGGRGWALGSDGDNEGASFRCKTTPFLLDRSAKKFWMEMRIKSSTITDTKHGVLCGLMEDAALTATVPITAAGAIADINMVGFRRDEADGDYLDTVYKANGVTAVTVQSDAVLLAADTYVNIGMVYEPGVDPIVADPTLASNSKYNLFFYANNLRLSSAKIIPTAQGTDFPNDVRMGPFFAVLNATGSTPGDSSISRCRAVQLF